MDLSAYRDLYLQEARRQVQRAESLVADEETVRERVVELFRCFHTLKGMSATMNQGAIAEVAHALEDVCDAVRKGTAESGPEVVSLLADGLAHLARQLRAFDEVRELESAAAIEARVQEYLRTGANTGFTLIVEGGDELDVPDDGPPPGLRMDGAVSALSEVLSACAHLRTLAPQRADVIAEADRIEAAAHAIYDDLVQLRRVPFGTVLPPLRRQVRALAARLGKRVRLDVGGESLPVDQQVLARLQGALVHVVLNAVVHGIEAPESRLAAGKDATGVVQLDVERVGAELVVTIEDDGRGFDRTALRDAAHAPDGDPVALAFLTGVSTHAEVDDVAGRGVGLGVVRGTVDALGGRLVVSSTEGRGARFRIEVPLHADLVRLVLVEASGQVLALPATAVQGEAEAGPGAPGLLDLPVGGRVGVRLADDRVVRVDRVVATTESLMSPPPFPLNRLPHIRGTTLAPEGQVVLVVTP